QEVQRPTVGRADLGDAPRLLGAQQLEQRDDLAADLDRPDRQLFEAEGARLVEDLLGRRRPYGRLAQQACEAAPGAASGDAVAEAADGAHLSALLASQVATGFGRHGEWSDRVLVQALGSGTPGL